MKPEVRRRLDEIASQTLAHIAVVNSPLSLSTRTPPDGISSSAGWSGLETERVCELVITGQGDSVEIARVRLLVMLDELVRFGRSYPRRWLPTLIHRAACTLRFAKLTKNYKLSLWVVNVTSCSPSRRRLPQTSTFPLPCKASLAQMPPLVSWGPVLPFDRTKAPFGSQVNFSGFSARGICCCNYR